MKNDTFEILVPGPKCSGPKLFRAKVFLGRSIHRAKVFSGPKYSPGRSILWAEVVSGPKLFRAEVFPGQSECRAKAVSGPNWVWANSTILYEFAQRSQRSLIAKPNKYTCKMNSIFFWSQIFFSKYYFFLLSLCLLACTPSGQLLISSKAKKC